MIDIKYKPTDTRYLFMVSDNNDEMVALEKYLNKIPDYMFMPSFTGIPKPEVFLNKFISRQVPGQIIYWCHSGLWKTIYDWCEKNHVEVQGIDNNFKYTDFNMTLAEFKAYIDTWGLNLIPYDYQYKAAWLILKYKQSLSELATRSGKTLIAYMVFRYMLENGAHNILMIVPSIHLVKQGVEDMKEYKEFFASETVWAKGEYCQGSNLTIGTFQSLVKKADRKSKNYDPGFFKKFDVVCVDEAHHLKCQSINTILSLNFMKDIKLKFGFSGSLPKDNTIESFCCHSLMGPKINTIKAIELVDDGFLAEPNITQIHIKYAMNDDLVKSYIKYGEYLNSSYVLDNGKKVTLPKEQRDFTMQHVKTLPLVLKQVKQTYSDTDYMQYLISLCKGNGSKLLMLEQMLLHHSQRRVEIMIDILSGIEKNCIVFAHHTEYLKYLKTIFEKRFPDRPVYIIHGQTTLKRRLKIVNNMLTDANAILVASYDCVGTGLTFKNVDYGIFAQSFKSDIINKQSLGRLMLKNREKSEFFLYDMIDYFPTKRIENQGKAKLNIYKEQGYSKINIVDIE